MFGCLDIEESLEISGIKQYSNIIMCSLFTSSELEWKNGDRLDSELPDATHYDVISAILALRRKLFFPFIIVAYTTMMALWLLPEQFK